MVRHSKESLLPEEKVVAVGRISKAIWIPIIESIVIAIVLFVLGTNQMKKEGDFVVLFYIGASLFFLGAIIGAIRTWIFTMSHNIVLTNRRLVIKEGLFNKQIGSIMLDTIEGIASSQPLIGRILNYGDIVVRSAGVEQRFIWLKDIVLFHGQIQACIQELKDEQIRKNAMMTSSGMMQALAQLAAMQQQGQIQRTDSTKQIESPHEEDDLFDPDSF